MSNSVVEKDTKKEFETLKIKKLKIKRDTKRRYPKMQY